jgi:hypothetical protein
MNLFYLDEDMQKCAAYHVDKHVVKMPLEALQVCSTALYTLDRKLYDDLKLYKPTHAKHPLVRWATESLANTKFVARYGVWVAHEYNYRYYKTHACDNRLYSISAMLGEVGPPTTLPQCMPDEFKHDNPITGYRNYYANAKARLHKWSARSEPSWITAHRRVPATVGA